MRAISIIAVTTVGLSGVSHGAELRPSSLARQQGPEVSVIRVIPQPVSRVIANPGRPTEMTYVLHPVREYVEWYRSEQLPSK